MFARLIKHPIKLLIFLGLLLVCFLIFRISAFVLEGVILATEAPFLAPSKPFEEKTLVGSWFVSYSTSRNEELYIFNNGTYKQIYKDKGIAIESPLNNWWLEELSDGGIYLHLEGAKYYFYGPSRTDKYKTICPAGDSTCEQVMNQISNEAYDWIGNIWIDVSDQLILNVRMESNGNIILMHLWDSSDQGFPIIGGESEIYRKKGEMDK